MFLLATSTSTRHSWCIAAFSDISFRSLRPYGLGHDTTEDLMAGSSHASTGFEDSLFGDHTGGLMDEILMDEPFGTSGGF